MGAAPWVISTPLRKREAVASERSALSVSVKRRLASVSHFRVILTAHLLLLHRLDGAHLQGWPRAGALMVENGQFAESKGCAALRYFATLHQEGQKIHTDDTVQFCPWRCAAPDILLTSIHPCCCSEQKTSPEHGVETAKHSSLPQMAATRGPCARMPIECR